jgi:hypothetical protein
MPTHADTACLSILTVSDNHIIKLLNGRQCILYFHKTWKKFRINWATIVGPSDFEWNLSDPPFVLNESPNTTRESGIFIYRGDEFPI